VWFHRVARGGGRGGEGGEKGVTSFGVVEGCFDACFCHGVIVLIVRLHLLLP
jgi:hypothetical protein